MSRKLEIWCDECGALVNKQRLVQWSGCAENSYTTRDYCGYPCAEKNRARTISALAKESP